MAMGGPLRDPLTGGDNLEKLVIRYFNEGFQYTEILDFLKECHELKSSLRTLHRILRKHGLRRKNIVTNSDRVIRSISSHLQSSHSMVGYRTMHQILNAEGLYVDRETVRIALKILDPRGVMLRSQHRLIRRIYQNKGPNFLWHIDGHDKLKPFGLCIHGCIDGYSRKVMWLKVLSNNKDGKVIANFFLQTVNAIQSTPRCIRADRGVENCVIAGIQRYFNRNNNFQSSFLFGKSTSNQRIEAWWSILIKQCLHWWINYFKDMRDSGLFDDSNTVHLECLQFCYFGVLQDELTNFMYTWNHHYIRKVRNSESPHGRPDALYFIERGEVSDFKSLVSARDMEIAREFTRPPNTFCCSYNFAQLASNLMSRNTWQYPRNVSEAKILFVNLVNEIYRIRQT